MQVHFLMQDFVNWKLKWKCHGGRIVITFSYLPMRLIHGVTSHNRLLLVTVRPGTNEFWWRLMLLLTWLSLTELTLSVPHTCTHTLHCTKLWTADMCGDTWTGEKVKFTSVAWISSQWMNVMPPLEERLEQKTPECFLYLFWLSFDSINFK